MLFASPSISTSQFTVISFHSPFSFPSLSSITFCFIEFSHESHSHTIFSIAHQKRFHVDRICHYLSIYVVDDDKLWKREEARYVRTFPWLLGRFYGFFLTNNKGRIKMWGKMAHKININNMCIISTSNNP